MLPVYYTSIYTYVERSPESSELAARQVGLSVCLSVCFLRGRPGKASILHVYPSVRNCKEHLGIIENIKD